MILFRSNVSRNLFGENGSGLANRQDLTPFKDESIVRRMLEVGDRPGASRSGLNGLLMVEPDWY